MLDKYNLYVQADGSNGDSAHRSGLIYGLTKLTTGNNDNRLLWAIIFELQIQERPGVYIRHPADYEGDWSANPRCFSRDQASRLIFGYAVNDDKAFILDWLKAMAKRGFFHQNNMNEETGAWKMPDIIGPGELRNVIRGLNLWILYPLLVFLDALFIIDVYTRKPWDGASLYVPDLKFALKKFWTPTAWLANKLNNRTPWLEEALNNHALENNGCVELQPLFKKLAEIN